MKIAILGIGALLIYLGVTGRYKPLWESIFPPKAAQGGPGS